MIRALLLSLGLLLCLTTKGFSQVSRMFGSMPYRHFTSRQGLAGSNVLAFKQDTEGYIWIATSSGLSRLDGTDIINYTTNDGLLSNNLTGIECNSGDSVFISSYDHGINVFYRNRFTNYGLNKDKIPLIHHMLMDGRGHMYIYSGYLKEIFDRKLTVLRDIVKMEKSGELGFQITNGIKLSGGNLLFVTSRGLLEVNEEGELLSKATPNGKLLVSVCQDDSGTTWFGGYGEIWQQKNGNFRRVFDDLKIPDKYPIQNIFVDHNQDVWFSQANGQLFLIRDNKLSDLSSALEIQYVQVNFISGDDEGNIWIGTYGKGLFCFYNLAVTNFSTKDHLGNSYINALGQDPEGRLLIGTFNGLNILDNNKFVPVTIGFKGDYHYIRGIMRAQNGKMYISGSYDLKYVSSKEKVATGSYKNIPYRFLNCASLYATNDNDIIMGGWDNNLTLKRVSDGDLYSRGEIRILKKDTQSMRVNVITRGNDGSYWIGTTNGLCRLTGKSEAHFYDNTLLNSSINDVKINNKGEVWVVSNDGVARKSGDKWTNFSSTDHFDLTSSKSIAFDRDGNTWIGTLRGLYKITGDSVSYYKDILGLNSDEINAVYYEGMHNHNNLWVGTSEGLSRINLDMFRSFTLPPPVVYIEEVRTSDSTYSISPGVKLPDFKQRKFTIKFSAINFRNPKSLLYEYRNNNDDSEWETTDQTEIQFASLYRGENIILVRARTINGEWGKPAQIEIFITTPFYKSYWFYGLIMLALLIPALLVTRMIIEKRQKKEIEKRDVAKRIVELKQQAMAAMMNPHFIFNSLNSIQNFINNHGKKEANLYLTSFARLIRMNMDISQSSYVKLSDELERLNLYLKLEKMRFGDDFNYSISVGKNIDPSKILIPNMIIQPFVENGIWHGILPNDESGSIEVEVEFGDEKSLVLIIKDDGIGFVKSFGMNKKGHISKGIEIIRERLKLLSGGKESDEIIKISPLNENDPDRTGTIVKVILSPKLYLFETSEH